MQCPRCGSQNVQVQIIQTGGVTRTRGRGCLWTLGRWTLIICTCGLWLLVGRSRAKSQTRFRHQTQAVCQSCGNHWVV